MSNSLKLLFALNIADISLTKRLTDLGAYEINPIMSYLMSVDFLLAFLFKLLIVMLFIYLIVKLKNHVAGVSTVVKGLNLFFMLLVFYQVIGILVLS